MVEDEVNFDLMYLGAGVTEGLGHLESIRDVAEARTDGELLLSAEALKFCKLIILHGMLPSAAYAQAFATVDEFGNITRPDVPAYQSRQLLKLPEVIEHIAEMRTEMRLWSKTEVEEIENNLRNIAFNSDEKTTDRIAATKAISALRGFDAQPENAGFGGVINLIMPFTPKQLGGKQEKLVEDNT
jgi:hypothetical protein